MKIAFFDQTGDVVGGAQESLLLLLTHLPPDFEPVVVLFHEGVFAERVRAVGVAVEILNIAPAIASSTRSRVRLENLVDVPRTLVQIGALLRRLRVSVVHTNTVKSHFLVLPMAAAMRVPTVAHLRDILSGRARSALVFVLRNFARRSIAISYSVERCYGLKAGSTIRNPVDLRLFTSLPTKGEARRLVGLPQTVSPIFAIVGRVNKWKGHDVFLAAALRAIEGGSDARFAIVGEPRFGDEDYLEVLKRFVADHHLEERISFVPWQADMPLLYSAIDVLVNCSEKEPFGRTVIEAAAAGVPTICFDDAGVAEFISLAGLRGVVRTGDTAGLTAEIERYSSDQDARTEAGKAFKRWASSFSAVTHADDVVRLFREVALK